MINKEFILSSGSKIRAELLNNAGLNFRVIPADIDESNLQKTVATENLSLFLAEKKALDVSSRNYNFLVVGCDQTLLFEGKLLHKVDDFSSAFARLKSFSGKIHYLETSVAIAFNNEIIWRYSEKVKLQMRELTDSEIEKYLLNQGDKIFQSVSAYQLEGPAIQFFTKIEGDYFTILGLPLLPLLNILRELENKI